MDSEQHLCSEEAREGSGYRLERQRSLLISVQLLQERGVPATG